MSVKTIRIYETGDPDVMRIEDIDLQTPGPSEIQINHSCIGVNFLDLVTRQGFFPASLPSGLGREAVGVVEKIGDSVEGFTIGDRVTYFTETTGAYAEARNVPSDAVVNLPQVIDDEIVAASFSKGLTAHHLIRQTYDVKRDDWVVVHAAAGGVGSLMTQWANELGANVIGIVGSEAKIDAAKRNGCLDVFLTKDDWANQVRDVSDGGAHVVYDSVGKNTFRDSMKALRPRGLLASFGNASGPPPDISPMELMTHGSIYLTRTSGKDYFGTPEGIKAGADIFLSMIKEGKINVHIGHRFALSDVVDAHRAIEARETVGCTILLP